ncbi:conserved hypothetical protein [Ricinus communis]|uniref:RNase H type-1 domain-containing protein n=1 Tax=Ricinus communis TaxID=3988 RepID=B9RU68_RICCO|nr:conserved hypothetical protein [Ricinus communis]
MVDKEIWHFDAKGRISVKSAYKAWKIVWEIILAKEVPIHTTINVSRVNQISTPLALEQVKFNTDVAFLSNEEMAGLAVIVRNSRGRMLDGVSRRVKAASPMVTEGLAFLEAVKPAKAFSRTHCIFETDCPNLFSALCVHVPREANWCANWVASTVVKESLPSCWIATYSCILATLLESDCNETSFN